MKQDIRLYLQDIQESIPAIEDYTENLTEQQFLNNRQTQDVVIRRFEIIGEAVKNLDMRFRELYPTIPWREIAGMRDIFIHEYFGIKLRRVWDAVMARPSAAKTASCRHYAADERNIKSSQVQKGHLVRVSLS